MSFPTLASSESGPQILANVVVGLCECPVSETGLGCDDMQVDLEPIGGPRAYLFANGVDHVRELRFGIWFDPVDDNFGWRVCPNGFWDSVIPTETDGRYDVVLTSMDPCHVVESGFHFLVCVAFSPVGPSTLSVVPHSTLGEAQIVTCDGTTISIDEDALAVMGIGGEAGYNPCKDPGSVPTAPASWSRVKSLY